MRTPKECYQASVNKGFYDPIPSKEQRLVLIISELAEVVEAIRKNRWLDQLSKEQYKHAVVTTNIQTAYSQLIKGCAEEEVADTVIRILDYMGFKGYEVKEVKISSEFTNDMAAILELMKITTTLISCEKEAEEFGLNFLLSSVTAYATWKGIPLDWHVDQKFLFNQSRPYKHGKKF